MLSDDARAVKALALNRAIVNDATMLTLCRIQKGVVGTTRLVSGDQTIYVKFGTFDVGRMYLAAK